MKKRQTWISLTLYYDIPIWEINPDKNNNNRYVVEAYYFGDKYEAAINNARKFGGKIYRAKWYGKSAFVFTTNCPECLCLKINELNKWGEK